MSRKVTPYLTMTAYLIFLGLFLAVIADMQMNFWIVLPLITFSVLVIYMSDIKEDLAFNWKVITEIAVFILLFQLLLHLDFIFSEVVFLVLSGVNYLAFRKIHSPF